MALLTKKEFAALCNMDTNKLAAYASAQKRKVIYENNLIDPSNPINKLFLAKHGGEKKEKVTAAPVENIVNAAPKPPKELKDPNETPPIDESEARLKYLKTISEEKDIELTQIDIDKKRGLLIPTELIKLLLLQMQKHISSKYREASESIIDLIALQCDLSPEKTSHLRKENIDSINKAISEAAGITASGIQNIIDEYSITRGRVA